MNNSIKSVVNQMRKYVHEGDDGSECRVAGHTLTMWANTLEQSTDMGGIQSLAIVEKFGEKRLCRVECYGEAIMMAYPKERTAWIERAEDEYGIDHWLSNTPRPCCVLRREDWLRGEIV